MTTVTHKVLRFELCILVCSDIEILWFSFVLLGCMVSPCMCPYQPDNVYVPNLGFRKSGSEMEIGVHILEM